MTIFNEVLKYKEIILFISCLLVAFLYFVYVVFEWLHIRLSNYPLTKFGFHGKLIYVDNSPKSKVFVNHAYELVAKPDFIYKIGLNKYVIVEYKSRSAPVKPSDIAQLFATAIAVRSEFKVVKGYIVTESEMRTYEFGSSSAVYRKIKSIHKRAKELKFLGYKARVKKKPSCYKCGYNYHCFSGLN